MSAHVGPWQVAPLVTKYYGLNISTIYAPESNAVVAELMLDLRQFLGEKLISSEEGLRPLIKELKAGNSIKARMALGNAYFKQGDYRQSLKIFNGVLNKNPSHKEAQSHAKAARQKLKKKNK